MGKAHVNIGIDMDVLDAAKEANINISQTAENALRSMTQGEEVLTTAIANAEAVLADGMEKIKRLRDVLDGAQLKLSQIRDERFDKMPEVIALKPEQVEDPKALLELVGQLRGKYNTRISVIQLQDYVRRRAKKCG